MKTYISSIVSWFYLEGGAEEQGTYRSNGVYTVIISGVKELRFVEHEIAMY